MKREINITNIGAGSLYTPDFALMLIENREKLNIKEWRMMDIDPERLHAVANFSQRILDEAGMGIQIKATTDLTESVRDADYIFTTIRVGGADARILDETIPIKYGLIGQETTAPGGLAMGLRNIPAIVDIANKVTQYAHPNAWLINLSNPSGMLTEAVYRFTDCKAIGLCNWPRSFWTRMMEAYGVERNDVFLELVGLNHLFWARVFINGRDVNNKAGEKFKQIFAMKYGDDLVNSKFTMPPDVSDFVTDWPLIVQYCRYYYLTDEMVKEQDKPFDDKSKKMLDRMRGELPEEILNRFDFSRIKTRADFVKDVDDVATELYEEYNKDGMRLVQGTRGGEGYGAAGLDIVLAMENNLNEVQGIDYPNLGSVPGLPSEVVVEHSCLINAAGVYPLSMPALKPHMHAWVNAAKQYEISACEAAMEGNYRKALEALMANPLIHDFNKARDCLNELLVAHKEFLPNFTEAIKKIEKGERPY